MHSAVELALLDLPYVALILGRAMRLKAGPFHIEIDPSANPELPPGYEEANDKS